MRRLFIILAFVALASLLAASAAEAQQGGSARFPRQFQIGARLGF